MAQFEQLSKYRNAVINIAIIIVALVIASGIYKSNVAVNNSLKVKISEEEKKSIEMEKISGMKRKISAYKRLLTFRETNMVMNDIVGIAKSSGVKVLSIKPAQQEAVSDYIKNNFDVSVEAFGYEDLARFINMLEASENVYMVDNITIDKKGGQDNSGLIANLRISSVAAKIK